MLDARLKCGDGCCKDENTMVMTAVWLVALMSCDAYVDDSDDNVCLEPCRG